MSYNSNRKHTLTVSISAWVSNVIAFSTTMISGCMMAIVIFISPPAAVCAESFWPPPNRFHSQELPNTYNSVHQETWRRRRHTDSKVYCETAQAADQRTISTSKCKYSGLSTQEYHSIETSLRNDINISVIPMSDRFCFFFCNFNYVCCFFVCVV